MFCHTTDGIELIKQLIVYLVKNLWDTIFSVWKLSHRFEVTPFPTRHLDRPLGKSVGYILLLIIS